MLQKSVTEDLEVLLRNSEKKKCNVLAEHISQSLWMKAELECKKVEHREEAEIFTLRSAFSLL